MKRKCKETRWEHQQEKERVEEMVHNPYSCDTLLIVSLPVHLILVQF